MIKAFYGDRTAERSKVPLILHIDEGLAILEKLEANETVKRAFCLHPMLQGDKELKANWIAICLNPAVDRGAILLAMEYRRAANAYLCTEDTDHFLLDTARKAIGLLMPEVRQMLIADKRQNQKDFLIHHAETHPRRNQLDVYFKRWLLILEGPPSGKP
ncbi:hypothetical protein Voja6_00035 [Pseudomonas phage vB_PpuM-Voja-6]